MAKTYKELQEEIENLELRIKTLESQNDLHKTAISTLRDALKTVLDLFGTQAKINELVDRKLKTLGGKDG